MYVRELHIRNLKLLSKLDLYLTRSTTSGLQPRMWTVLLGENGLCKTTILQAIALAASGYVRANQLADVPSLADRRSPAGEAQITASFGFSQRSRAYPDYDAASGPPTLNSNLLLPKGTQELTGHSMFISPDGQPRHPPAGGDPVREARARNLPLWFVAGYGTLRVLPRPMASEKSEDPAVSRLNPLFDKGRIIGTGFADILADTNEYARILREALVTSGLLPHTTTLELRGRGGVRTAVDLIEGHRFGLRVGQKEVKVPATWMSQGYQATIAWIADLVGHVFWEAGGPVDLDEMEGLVLIDEIDLHLHPRWQVELVPVLKRLFPLMQFVVTTHSPMILPGLEQDEIVMLRRDDEGNVVADEAQQSPMLMTGSEIYTTFFGLPGLYPTDLAEAMHRYGFLVGNPRRTDAEETEMIGIRDQLRKHGVDPGWTPAPRSAP